MKDRTAFGAREKRLKLAEEVKLIQARVPKVKQMLFDTDDAGFFISLINKAIKKIMLMW